MLAIAVPPTIEDLISAHPNDEVKERRFVAAVLKPGDFFIDCGAHRFLYTRLASAIVGDRGLVLAIDPFLQFLPFYERTENVRPIPMAVGGTVGAVEFDCYDMKHAAWNNAVGMDMVVKPESKAMVHMTRLSSIIDVFGEGRKVDYLKLDVEGNERDVLRDIFWRDIRPRYIQFESSSVAMIRQTPAEIVEVLHAHGYAVHVIGGDGMGERVYKVDGFYDNFVAVESN